MLKIMFMIAFAFLNKPEAILITAYDPALGGTNCVDPCGQMATGYWWTEADYYDGIDGVAACPTDWLGHTIDIKHLGKFRCLDTGGAIQRFVPNSYYDQLVTHVDILCKNPMDQSWNYWLTDDWVLE